MALLSPKKDDSRQGLIYGLIAFFLWGTAPAFFKLLEEVPTYEIIAHRVLWSVALLILFIIFSRTRQSVINVLKQPKKLLWLLLSSLLVCANWTIFVWAVNDGQILATSLGYFIMPLCNVFLGYIYFKERFSRLQWVALVLAALGIIVQIWVFGTVPIVTLGIVATFTLYGFIRKLIKVESIPGLFIETIWLAPIALIYLLFFTQDSTTANLFNNRTVLNLFLMASGLITTIPLLLFNAAALRVRLSTLGLIQYLGPSMSFLLAVFIYNEPMGPDKWVTFAFIWAGLALFILDSVLQIRKVNNLIKAN